MLAGLRLSMGLAHYRVHYWAKTRRPSALCRNGVLIHIGENLNAEVFGPGPSVFVSDVSVTSHHRCFRCRRLALAWRWTAAFLQVENEQASLRLVG